MTNRCQKCNKNQTAVDPVFGISPYCKDCENKLRSFKTKVPEMVGEGIKENRLKYASDIVAHHYKGHLNKEWLESKWGGVKRAKAEGYTDKEIKDAGYVYSGSDTYYKKY